MASHRSGTRSVPEGLDTKASFVEEKQVKSQVKNPGFNKDFFFWLLS